MVPSFGPRSTSGPRSWAPASRIEPGQHETPLFWEGGDAGRCIDHRLLAHSNEASDRPVEVQDQKYDRPDQQSNEINGQPLTPLIEPAGVTCECARDGGYTEKHQHD